MTVSMATLLQTVLQFAPPTYTQTCKHFSLVPRPHPASQAPPSSPGHAQLSRPRPASQTLPSFPSLTVWKSSRWSTLSFRFFHSSAGRACEQRFCIGWKYHLDSHSFSFVWTACIPTPNYSKLASFPGPTQLSTAISGRGPGIFSHVSDIRIERMVERV